MEISIHAPTRGATEQAIAKLNGDWISIHAPTRGATLYDVLCHADYEFQSTLLREERL